LPVSSHREVQGLVPQGVERVEPRLQEIAFLADRFRLDGLLKSDKGLSVFPVEVLYLLDNFPGIIIE
jgi:hypothetical protein